jgi:hypothetical protein
MTRGSCRLDDLPACDVERPLQRCLAPLWPSLREVLPLHRKPGLFENRGDGRSVRAARNTVTAGAGQARRECTLRHEAAAGPPPVARRPGA